MVRKVSDDETKAAGFTQDLAKDENHGRLMRLTAPVDGTVQQPDAHTIGGVVTAEQALMTVVPDGGHLLLEANIDNGDIGFIKVGRPAEVKIERYPFTRYGTLHGDVMQVSNDAKQDDKKNWVFTTQVALPQDNIQIDDRTINLMPGMEVTAEIKTDRRRIIGYLLSPLIQHAKESLRER